MVEIVECEAAIIRRELSSYGNTDAIYDRDILPRLLELAGLENIEDIQTVLGDRYSLNNLTEMGIHPAEVLVIMAWARADSLEEVNPALFALRLKERLSALRDRGGNALPWPDEGRLQRVRPSMPQAHCGWAELGRDKPLKIV